MNNYEEFENIVEGAAICKSAEKVSGIYNELSLLSPQR